MLVLDATLAITFGAVRRLDIITDLQLHDTVIPPRAAAEVVREPARSEVRTAIRSGSLPTVAINLGKPPEVDALVRFDGLPAFRGRGDAEVLALAAVRVAIVGSDDRAVRTAARQEFGPDRVAGSLDILVWAIREGRLTAAAADHLLNTIDVGPALQAKLARLGKNLADLV